MPSLLFEKSLKKSSTLEPFFTMKRARKFSRKKRHKVIDIKQNVPPIDRLSSLPDEGICHILSFLPLKLSVRTSILGKRWRFLWAHDPNLEFDSEDYPRHSTTRPSFSSIVNTVMSLHKVQSLNTFRLWHRDDCPHEDNGSAKELEACIATAIDVRILDLSVDVDLPRCFLTCKTLVDLRMYDGVEIPSGRPISLPSLKMLYFNSRDFHEGLPHLLSGCPALEELVIEGTPFDDSGCCNIDSPTLKKLSIDFPLDSALFKNPNYRVKINAPALRYLKVCECSHEHVTILSPNSLIEADISVNTWLGEIAYQRCVLKFLYSLCDVTCLNLSGFGELFDIGVAGPYGRFNKLTKLELNADWRFLTKYLENADNLEVLIIHEAHEDSKS